METMKTRMVQRLESELKKQFENNLDEIDRKTLFNYIAANYVAEYKYYTVSTFIKYLNVVLELYGNDNKFSVSDFGVTLESDGHVTKDEIISLVEALDNPQDQLILYGLFCGIYGKNAAELTNLKEDQIDFKNNTITLSDRVIPMDDMLKKIIIETINEDVYYIIDNNVTWNTSEIKLNMESEYIIKQRPSAKNGYGENPMSYNGFRTRVKNILNFLGSDLNITSIVRSGHIYRMGLEIKNPVTQSADEWIKKNNLSGIGWKFVKIYNNLYKK